MKSDQYVIPTYVSKKKDILPQQPFLMSTCSAENKSDQKVKENRGVWESVFGLLWGVILLFVHMCIGSDSPVDIHKFQRSFLGFI